MSNFALSCPHCGSINSASPQAIVLQEEPESSYRSSTIEEYPSSSVETRKAIPAEVLVQNKVPAHTHWIDDLWLEWRGLTSFAQHTIQILFGGSVLVVIGLWLYVMLA